jgi:hypothetical protein
MAVESVEADVGLCTCKPANFDLALGAVKVFKVKLVPGLVPVEGAGDIRPKFLLVA